MPRLPKLTIPPPFEEAIQSLERDLMRYLLRTTRDREDSLDLFQDTWLRAYRAYPTLRSADGLRPWIFTIAANLCRNRLRDRARRSRVISHDPHGDGDPMSALANAHAPSSPDGALHLRDEIARLPTRQRKALTMRKFTGLGYDEIGAALDCTPESARATVHQALKKIRAAQEP